jgi:type IV pilus assembly protein PilV
MPSRLAHGFTLPEVLVALVVLALGVLGAGAMQLTAHRVRQESQWLSSASRLAADFAGRLRANAAQADAIYAGFDYDSRREPVPDPSFGCGDAACDSAQLARADLAELKQQVAQALPSGRVRICRDRHMWHGGRLRWPCDGGLDAPLVIKIGWRGRLPDGRVDAGGGDGGEFAPGVALALAGVRP